ncbi:variable surface protein [Plasmodium gonderi]|uniref:Variable surface protein n=1 Tax=Plasmodium gonderi TaxID=77519 RepID=A0A1Y1JPE7_PLAGO|nr:variable surface protein [Plasmodium gonderi]GAW84120.1 variable surface protein [Plasmodium gonderi]
MKINIYEYANLFSKCDESIKKAEIRKSSYTNDCEGYEKKINQNIKAQFKEICPQTFSYLNDIQIYAVDNEKLKEAHCVYLYYWLYDSDGETKNSDDIKKLYDELINADNEHQDGRCMNYNDIIITYDEKTKLKDIYDMYTEIDKINSETDACEDNCGCAKNCSEIYKNHMETCKYNKISNFCNELRNIKKKYDKKMINVVCGSDIPKTLPSFQNYNITTLILIPVFVILAISSFLFIMYKFTPYGPSIRCATMMKRKHYNNIDKEKNILELYETNSCVLRNHRYHILYSSN